MPSTEIVLTGDKYPVELDGTTLKRVQSFSANRGRTVEEDWELGTEQAIGTSAGPYNTSGTMTATIVDTSIERLFCDIATATDPVDVTDLIVAAGMDIKGKDDGISGAVLQSITYNMSVPNGKLTADYNFKGTGVLAGDLAITAPASGGESSARSPKIFARFTTMLGGATHIARLRSIAINVQLRSNDYVELSNADPFLVDQSQPQVTATLEWHNIVLSPADPTSMLGYYPMFEASDAQSLIVQYIPTGDIADWDAEDNLKFTVYNLVAERNQKNQSVGQGGTRSINYRSNGHATYGGFRVRVMPDTGEEPGEDGGEGVVPPAGP